MDMNIRTHIQQSEINGLFQEVEQLKRQRTNLKETIDKKTDKIISHILKNGSVIVYKNDVPHVLTVKNGSARKFDKAKLADDTGRTQSELDVVGIAELVEESKVSSKRLEEYFYEEPTQTLKARKAKKTDLELVFGGRV